MRQHIAALVIGISAGFVSLAVPAQDMSGLYGDSEEMAEEAMKRAEELIDEETLDQFEGKNADPRILEKAKEVASESKTLGKRGSEATTYDRETNSWAYDNDAVKNAMAGKKGKGKDKKADPLVESDGEVRYLMLLSLGMPDAQLKQSLIAMQGHDNVKGVVQGLVHEDATIPDTAIALKRKVDEFEIDGNSPGMFLDPSPFQEHRIEQVPTLLRFKGDELTHRVAGLPNIEWLERQAQKGEETNLGVRGETFPISEENLLETIKRRVDNLDKEKIAEGAADRMWDHYEQFPMPEPDEDHSYLVDLTVTVDRDIRAPNGALVAAKGDKKNPLHMVSFNQMGIVIDGNRESHRDWAKERIQQALEKGLTPTVMTTHVEASDDGWEQYREMNSDLKPRVTVINQQIVDRFGIQKAPTTFVQEGDMMRVREHALEDSDDEQ